METKKNNTEFVLKSEKSFLLPRYWGAWLDVSASAGVALTPPPFRGPILGRLSRFARRLAKSSQRRTQIDLLYCFPKENEHEREVVIDAIYASTPQAMVMMAGLGLRDPQKILARVGWQEKEIIGGMRRNNEKVISLVPHAWGVDIPAMLMASGGQRMVAIFHNQGNLIFDYVWDIVRRRFGGRVHTRNDGVKPLIQSVRQSYQGYYLPDQDHGAEHSGSVDLFAIYKATLPAIGRLMKVCRIHVVPLFPVYDSQTYRLTMLVCPPMDDLLGVDDMTITRRMNEEAEVFVKSHTEQYAWILKLLKARKPDEIEPYKRKELFPRKQSKRELVDVPGLLVILRQ